MAFVDDPIIIESGEWKLISTGIYIKLPLGFEAQVRPRSGLALKKGITVLKMRLTKLLNQNNSCL